MVLDHLLPSVQPQSFLEWTLTSFEQSLAEFYAILHEDHLQVALEVLEMGICSSLCGFQNSPEWFSGGQIVPAREDVEVHHHALQT
jgi:hypothetical protein